MFRSLHRPAFVTSFSIDNLAMLERLDVLSVSNFYSFNNEMKNEDNMLILNLKTKKY